MPSAPDPHLPELLTCDVLFTGVGGGHAPGGVVVSGSVVAATGDPAALRASFPHAQERRVGEVIAPPPVNAHTHLDLTDMPLVNDHYERFIPTVIAFAAAVLLSAIRRSGRVASAHSPILKENRVRRT